MSNGFAESSDESKLKNVNEMASTVETARLRQTISHQHDLIDALNSKYSLVLGLLNDRSQAMHGSTVLTDVHRLETELRGLHTEKEHMMRVLDEKTREASMLKSEVHRLMSVVSAGKAAITKLQQDGLDVVRTRESSHQDMKKEAITRLSQLVRDKDLEIEALNQKNSTLLQVMGVLILTPFIFLMDVIFLILARKLALIFPSVQNTDAIS